MKLPFRKKEVIRPSAHADKDLRRGKDVGSTEVPRQTVRSADNRTIRKLQVPELLSGIPLPLRNPKQVKEPKTTHSGEGEVLG